MSSVNRERAMETKLDLLEQRLVLLERFVEMRFCDAFRDFATQMRQGVPRGKISCGTSSETKLKTDCFRAAVNKVLPETEQVLRADQDTGVNLTSVRTRAGRSTRRPARLSPTSLAQTSGCSTRAVDIDDEKSREREDSKISPELDTEERIEDDGTEDYFTFPNDEDNDGDSRDRDSCNAHNMESEMNVEVSVQTNRTEFENELSKVKKPPQRHLGTPKLKRTPYSTKKKAGSLSVTPGTKLVLQSSIREQCSICQKYFRKELLSEHMQLHTKERHLKCSYCDKTFFNRSMVIKHEKLHQPEKYAKKCRLCDKTTIESGKMLVHERSCIRRALEHKKFVDPALMEEIRRRSAGMDLKWPDPSSNTNIVKHKKCNYCNKYVHFAEYARHVKTHATWVCSVCNNSYVNKEGLAKHMRKIHGAVDEETTGSSKVKVEEEQNPNRSSEEKDSNPPQENETDTQTTQPGDNNET